MNFYRALVLSFAPAFISVLLFDATPVEGTILYVVTFIAMRLCLDD